MMCLRRILWLRRITTPLPCRLRNHAETELFLTTSCSSSSSMALSEEEEEVELGVVAGKPPSCTEADVDPALAQKLELCESEGLDRLHMKQLLSPRHGFCKCPLSRLVSIVALLKRRHITGKNAALVLSRCPWIFSYSPEIVDKKLAFLEELGLQTPHLMKVLYSNGLSPILGLAIHNMQRHVDLLHNFGIDRASIPRVIGTYPHFFCLNIDNNIKPTLQFLADKGMCKEFLTKLLLLRPSILGCSLDPGLTEKLNLIQYMGYDVSNKHGFRAFLHWCTLSSTRILANLEFLKSQGISHDEACKIAQQQPSILYRRQESIQKSLDYLKNVLNRDIQEVVKFPAYLTYSLTTRIAPRISVLNRDNFSLNYVLSLSNQSFDKRFVKKNVRRGRPHREDVGTGPAEASMLAV